MFALINSIHFGVMCVAFFLVFLLVKRKKAKWWLVASLTLIGGSSLALLTIGNWFSNTAGGLGATVIGILTIVALVLTIIDIGIDHKVDKVALFCLIALPMLFQAGSGPLAEGGRTVTTAVAEGAATGLAQVIGG